MTIDRRLPKLPESFSRKLAGSSKGRAPKTAFAGSNVRTQTKSSKLQRICRGVGDFFELNAAVLVDSTSGNKDCRSSCLLTIQPAKRLRLNTQ